MLLFIYKENLISFSFITMDVTCASPQAGFTLGTFPTVWVGRSGSCSEPPPRHPRPCATITHIYHSSGRTDQSGELKAIRGTNGVIVCSAKGRAHHTKRRPLEHDYGRGWNVGGIERTYQYTGKERDVNFQMFKQNRTMWKHAIIRTP